MTTADMSYTSYPPYPSTITMKPPASPLFRPFTHQILILSHLWGCFSTGAVFHVYPKLRRPSVVIQNELAAYFNIPAATLTDNNLFSSKICSLNSVEYV